MDLGLTVAGARSTAVTDLGRHAARSGLATGGARDQHAARSALALVGDPCDAPLLEVVLGELTLVPDRDALVAATGAAALAIDGVDVDTWVPVVVPAGARIRLAVRAGVAACLAVAGAIDVPRLAGSVAPDPALGFGTTPHPGAVLRVRDAPARLTDAVLGVGLLRPRRRLAPAAPGPVPLLPAPDGSAEVLAALTAGAFRVDPRSDHVGVRLRGALPDSAARPEPVSRGVPVGAVEVPGAPGELIVLQRGRSLTAGYPVAAVVPAVGQDRIAQLRPGDEVRFVLRDADRCRARAAALRADEAAVRAAVRSALAALAASRPRSGER